VIWMSVDWLQLQACARRRVDTIIVGQHQEGVKVRTKLCIVAE
jgi:hypothetical protein